MPAYKGTHVQNAPWLAFFVYSYTHTHKYTPLYHVPSAIQPLADHTKYLVKVLTDSTW